MSCTRINKISHINFMQKSLWLNQSILNKFFQTKHLLTKQMLKYSHLKNLLRSFRTFIKYSTRLLFTQRRIFNSRINRICLLSQSAVDSVRNYVNFLKEIGFFYLSSSLLNTHLYKKDKKPPASREQAVYERNLFCFRSRQNKL